MSVDLTAAAEFARSSSDPSADQLDSPLKLSAVCEFVNLFDFIAVSKEHPEVCSAAELSDPDVVWYCMHEIYPPWFDDSVRPVPYAEFRRRRRRKRRKAHGEKENAEEEEENAEQEDGQDGGAAGGTEEEKEDHREAYRTLIRWIDEFLENRFSDALEGLQSDPSFSALYDAEDGLACETATLSLYGFIVICAVQCDSSQLFVSKILKCSSSCQAAMQFIVTKYEDSATTAPASGSPTPGSVAPSGRAASFVSSIAASRSFGALPLPSTNSGSSKHHDNVDDSVSSLAGSAVELLELQRKIAQQADTIHRLKAQLANREEAYPDEEKVEELKKKLAQLEDQCRQEVLAKEVRHSKEEKRHETIMKEAEEQTERLESQIRKLQEQLDEEKKKAKLEEQKWKSRLKDLEDEVDIQRSQDIEVQQLKSQKEKYREQCEQLRESYKTLDEKCNDYMRKMVEMEADKKNTASVRKAMETYKCTAADLETETERLKAEVQQLDKRLKELQDQVDSLNHQIGMKDSEINLLTAQLAAANAEPLHRAETVGGDKESLVEMREKLARMEVENRLLKESHDTGSSEEMEGLLSQVDLLKRQKISSETALNVANAKVAVLEQQAKSQGNGSVGDAAELQSAQLKVASLEAKGADDAVEIKKLRQEKDELTAKVLQLMEQRDSKVVASLEAMEANAKMEKQYNAVADSLRQQLQVREVEMSELKKKLKQSEEGLAKEQQLLVSTFCEIGLRYHQQRAYNEQLVNELDAIKLSKYSVAKAAYENAPKSEEKWSGEEEGGL